MENELINNIKKELSKRIRGDIEVELYVSPNKFIHVLNIYIKYNYNRDIFITSFSLQYYLVVCDGDNATNMQYESYIVNSACDRYRDYILSKYFKEY